MSRSFLHPRAIVSLLLITVLVHTTAVSARAADLAQLLVSNVFNSSVEQVSDSGANPSTLIAPNSGGMAFATGVTMGPDGDIYVSSLATGQIFQYYPDGTPTSANPFLTLPQDPNPLDPGTTAPAAPAHLQFYNGSLYVSDHESDDILQFPVTKDPVSGALSIAPNTTPTIAAAGLVAAGGFTIAAGGDLYASSFAEGEINQAGSPPFFPAVVKVPHNGTESAFAFPLTDGSGNVTSPITPSNPNGVLFVHNTLLVADIAGSEILKYDQNGSYLGVFATIPGPNGQPNNLINSPSDFVLGPDGHSVYVAVLGDGDPTNMMDPNQVPDGTVLKYNFTVDGTGHIVASGSPIIIDSNFAASSIAIGASRGDMNLDGEIDAADIRALLTALADPTTYELQRHITASEFQIMADVNGDGQITNADVQALILMLQNQGGTSLSSVPEPSAGLLAGLALATLLTFPRLRTKK